MVAKTPISCLCSCVVIVILRFSFSSLGHTRTLCRTALLLKSSGLSLFIPVRFIIRKWPSDDAPRRLSAIPHTSAIQLISPRPKLTFHRCSSFSLRSPSPRLHISTCHYVTLLHTSLHSCQAVWLLSHLLLPPAIHLLSPPLLQRHFENFSSPHSISSLSCRLISSRCASEEYRAYLALQAPGLARNLFYGTFQRPGAISSSKFKLPT